MSQKTAKTDSSRRAMPNDKKVYEVQADELPLHCPLPNMSLWNSHPRVFLPLDKSPSGKVKCPYCGTDYILIRHQVAGVVAKAA